MPSMSYNLQVLLPSFLYFLPSLSVNVSFLYHKNHKKCNMHPCLSTILERQAASFRVVKCLITRHKGWHGVEKELYNEVIY